MRTVATVLDEVLEDVVILSDEAVRKVIAFRQPLADNDDEDSLFVVALCNRWLATHDVSDVRAFADSGWHLDLAVGP